MNRTKKNRAARNAPSLMMQLINRQADKALGNSGRYPLVSVVCPSYNRREFLPYLLYIYQYQDYPADCRELIILDDSANSNQDLITLLVDKNSGENVRYIHSPKRLALGEKRNKLNALATGEYIVCMDDDDYYPPNKISHALTQMQRSKSLFSGSNQIYIWYSHLDKIYKTASFGDKHASNGTFAYHHNYLKKHRYIDEKMVGEEPEFLDNFTVPIQQIAPEHSILCISHSANTFDKDFIMSSSIPVELTLEDIVQDKNLLAHYRRLSHGPVSQQVNWAFFEKIVIVTHQNDEPCWQQLRQQLIDFGMDDQQLIRFPAVEHSSYAVAQSETHLAILRQAKNAGWRNYLLLEEDIQFVKQEKTLLNVNRFLASLNTLPWEVALLGADYYTIRILATLPGVVKINAARAACAYAVNQPYYDSLLDNLEQGLLQLTETQNPAKYALDIHWQLLMERDRWLAIYPSFAYQTRQWSETKQCEIDCTHLFFKKKSDKNLTPA